MLLGQEVDKNNFSDELKEAKKAAKLAGEKIRELYRGNDGKFQIKPDSSELTSADLISNEILIKELTQKFPYKIVSEEGEDSTIDGEYVWIIDPLDGTKDFISKSGEFSIIVGLLKNAIPYLGVVYLPLFDKMYFAQRGAGAYLEENGNIKRINVSPLDKNYRAIISKNHYTERDKEFADFLGILDPIKKGSVGIKICEIAEGNADLYHNFDGLNKWDICAPQIILEEAGGKVFDLSGKSPDYTIKDSRFRNGIIGISKCENAFFEKLNSFLKASQKTKEGKLIWITGLAGSGKTTIAEEVYKKIKEKHPNTVYLDGDNLREILGEQTTHDIEGRKRIAGIYSRFCSFLTNQGVNVVISTISLFHHIHEYNRKNNKNYYEIFLDVDKEVLVKRNRKGLYAGNTQNVMGIHQQPEIPQNPDLIIKNDNEDQLKENVDKIFKLIETRTKMNNFEKKNLNTKEWNYTQQARFYYKRPNYSKRAIEHLCKYMGTIGDNNFVVADIGAGTGNLSILLQDKVGKIIAIEPNQAMREIGIEITKNIRHIDWIIGTGEETTLPDNSVNVAAFGSSFSVVDREKALKEAHRILKKDGFFTCMWNHRDLTIPSQKKVEEIIKKYFPDYSHGIRREPQGDIILSSKLFNQVSFFEFPEEIEQDLNDYCEAWKSVKNAFWDYNTDEGKAVLDKIIKDIKEEFKGMKTLKLIYFTRIWVAKKENEPI